MSNQVLIPQVSTELAVWVRLLRGHSGLTSQISAELQREHGLSISAYEVLLLLSREPDGIRRVDLARTVQLTQSGITRLLDGLEKQGYVKKRPCATDARVSYAVLTPDGRRKLQGAADPYFDAVREALSSLYSDDELRTLDELLSRLPGAGGEAGGEDCEVG